MAYAEDPDISTVQDEERIKAEADKLRAEYISKVCVLGISAVAFAIGQG